MLKRFVLSFLCILVSGLKTLLSSVDYEYGDVFWIPADLSITRSLSELVILNGLDKRKHFGCV